MDLWHGVGNHRTAVAPLLPDLLHEARRAARGADDQRRALTLLAQVYHLAHVYLAYQSARDLVYLVADRGLMAAYEADDPAAVAAATWYAAQVHQSAGQPGTAIELAHDAAAFLPRLDSADPDLRACYGLVHLGAAWTHAILGEEGYAWREWDLADAAVRTSRRDLCPSVADVRSRHRRQLRNAHRYRVASRCSRYPARPPHRPGHHSVALPGARCMP